MFQTDFMLSRALKMAITFAFLILLFGTNDANAAHADQEMSTYLRLTEGSIPPVGTPFNCVADLDGKPYSAKLVQNCLQLIAHVPYILSARIQSNRLPEGGKHIEFVVRAKALVTQVLSFTVQPDDLPRLQAWVALNPNNLKTGGTYTPAAGSSTYQAIKQFYLARGILVGIVPTVRLEYRNGTAEVNFAITKGPNVPPQPAYFPYGPVCEDEVTYVDWSQVDQSVPIPLVEAQLRIRALGTCFTPEFAKQDEETLKNMAIFKNASLEYSGAKGARHMAVKIKGAPLPLAAINIRSFGAYTKCAENRAHDLPLVSTNLYSSAVARETTEYLKKVCSGPDRWVEVTEDDHLTQNGQLQVSFNVLVVPLQSVFIDGNQIK